MEADEQAPSASADNASPDSNVNPVDFSIGAVVKITPESLTASWNHGCRGEATISKLHRDLCTGAVCTVDVKFVTSGRTRKNVDVAHLSLHREELPKLRSRRSRVKAGDESKEHQGQKDEEPGEKFAAGKKRTKSASAKKKRDADIKVAKKQTPKKDIDSNKNDEDEDWILITGAEGNFSFYERLLQPPTRVLFWWDDDLGWIKGRIKKGLSKKLTKTSIKWPVSICFECDGKTETLDFFPKGLKRWKLYKEDVEDVMNELNESEDKKLKGGGKVVKKTPSKSTKSTKTAKKQPTKVASGKKIEKAVKTLASSSKKASKTAVYSAPQTRNEANTTTSIVEGTKATKSETSKSTSSKEEKSGTSSKKLGLISATKTSDSASTIEDARSRSLLEANKLSASTEKVKPISERTTCHKTVKSIATSEDRSRKMGIITDEPASETPSKKPTSEAFGAYRSRGGISFDGKENESDSSSPKQDRTRDTGGQRKRKPLGSLDPNTMSKPKKLKTEKMENLQANKGRIPFEKKEATPSSSTNPSLAIHVAQRRAPKKAQTDFGGTNKESDINKPPRGNSGSSDPSYKLSAPKRASLDSSTSKKPTVAKVSQSTSLQKTAASLESVERPKSDPSVADRSKAIKSRKSTYQATTSTQALMSKEREKADKLVDDVIGSQAKSKCDRKGSEDDSSSIQSSSGSSYSSTLEFKFSNADQEVMNTFVNTILNTRDEIQVEDLILLLNSDSGIKKNRGKPFSTREIEAHLERLHNEEKIYLLKSEGSRGTIYKS